MERKGLRVNAGKTNIMICVTGLDLLQARASSMCHLPHWCKQQQYSMQRKHSLGAQEVQWAQSSLREPKPQVLLMSRNCPTQRQKTTGGGSGCI